MMQDQKSCCSHITDLDCRNLNFPSIAEKVTAHWDQIDALPHDCLHVVEHLRKFTSITDEILMKVIPRDLDMLSAEERISLIDDLHGNAQFLYDLVEGNPREGNYCNTVQRLCLMRYRQKWQTRYLDMGLTFGRRAVSAAAAPADFSITLGDLLVEKYALHDRAPDIEEAIKCTQQAIHLVPGDSLQRRKFQGRLASHLLTQFRVPQFTHRYLDEAVTIQRDIIDSSETDVQRAAAKICLALTFQLRYDVLRDRHDRELAMRVAREALDIMPEAEMAPAVTEAIRDGERGIGLLPPVVPREVRGVIQLMVHLLARYIRADNKEGVEKFIEVARQVVDALSPNHLRAEFLWTIGHAMHARYDMGNAMDDLEECLTFYISATYDPSALPDTRLMVASFLVLVQCRLPGHWQRVYDAVMHANGYISVLMAARSLTNHEKQDILRTIAGLGCNAAAVAINAGQSPMAALNLLEQGRMVLDISFDRVRADVSDAEQTNPMISAESPDLADIIEAIGVTEPVFSQYDVHERPEFKAVRDGLVNDILEMPGFQDLPLTQERALSRREDYICRAASIGPIVIINISVHRCDAILVESGGVRMVPLPQLHEEDIESIDPQDCGKHTFVLEWLWDTLTSPVLDALGYTKTPTIDWQRICWIPTGALSRFPIHAAGYHTRRSGATALDRVISSYAPSVDTVVRARLDTVMPDSSSATPSPQALLVAIENCGLVYPTDEIRAIKGICERMSLVPIQPRQLKQDLMLHLPECKVFHFAGHGYTDKTDPLKSYLKLGGENANSLTIADIQDLNIRNKSPFLAYLSACGTGRVHDEDFLDESWHLVSAFQLAGFRHVIGTLWEVNDALCVDMAKITYETMEKGAMTDDSVCRALHEASRRLRDCWLDKNTPTGTLKRRRASTGAVHAQQRTKKRRTSDCWRYEGLAGIPRDVEMCDEPPILWVPYVHFGP